MSNDDNWNDDFGRDSFEQNDESARQPARKQGMSTGVKVLLVLLCVFGLGGLLCCGGIAFIGYQFVPTISNSPADVLAKQKEIADIELPADLKPQMSMSWDNFMFAIKVATFESDDAKSQLALTQIHIKVGNQADQEIQMKDMLRDQGGPDDRALVGEQTTSRTLKVKGVEQEFKFSTGEDSKTGRKVHRVTGTLPGRQGKMLLHYQTEDESYKEDEVIKMIESIK